jgi:hypothetical protein
MTMSLLEEQPSYKEPLSPIGMTKLGLAALFVIPSPKKMMETAIDSRFVDDEPFIDKRKPLSMMVAKGVFNNGEHMLIPVTAKMFYSAVWDFERFVLKDGQMFHLVKLIGAARNYVEDGTGLVQVILWRKEKECTAQHQMTHECNSNHYIRVIGEVKDCYGVHKIIAFNV